MSRQNPPVVEPAIVLKPLSTIDATACEPIRLGGLPQLPPEIDWPRSKHGPLHFFAQIDLARLPRQVETAGHVAAMPDFPSAGSVFVFLPLNSDRIYEEPSAVVRYTTADVSELPERELPKDIPSLAASDHVHPDGIAPCKTKLIRQFAIPLPYLSARAENPLWRNLQRGDPDTDLSARDAAHALQEASLASVLGPPPVSAKPGKRAHLLPPQSYFGKHNIPEPERFLWSWELIFRWSKEFLRLCLNETLQELYRYRDLEPERDDIRSIIRAFRSKRTAVKKRTHTPKGGALPLNWIMRMIRNGPRRRQSFDVQATGWLKVSSNARGFVPEWVKHRFVILLREILNATTQEDAVSDLQMLAGFKGQLWVNHHNVAGQAITAFENALAKMGPRAIHPKSKEQLWLERLIQQTTIPTQPTGGNFGGGNMPLQMFGAGFLMQSAAVDHAQDVLLLQIGDPFGIALNLSALVQIWIHPADLGHGDFNRIVATVEFD